MCKVTNPKDSALQSFTNPVLGRYRTLYGRSIFDHSTSAKAKCLDYALNEKVDATWTKYVFYREFARRIDVLRDSTHFVDACKRLDLNLYSVATHVVVLGVKEMENILFYDGYKTLSPFPEWKTPIIAEEKLKDYLEHPDASISSEPTGDKIAKAKKEKSNAA